MNRQEIMITMDLLQGNINRMCVADDKEELDLMYQCAQKGIDTIYQFNKKRLEECDED